jgi:16S rRNA (guanine966-N2)-methyltransferase
MSEFGRLDGVHVMDLYAGSGALGLEALSRGAASVLLVEADARAAAVIKANAAVVGLPGATVATDRVERLLSSPGGATPRTPAVVRPMAKTAIISGAQPPLPPGGATPRTPRRAPDRKDRDSIRRAKEAAVPGGPYDLVFADPPYAVTGEAVAKVLTLLGDGWLADEALVVVERATRSGPVDWPPGYAAGKSRRYGEATFWYGWYGSAAMAGHAEQSQAAVPGPSLDAPRRAHEE